METRRAVVQLDLSTGGHRGFKLSPWKYQYPIHPCFHYGHLREVPRLGTQSAQAASVEGRRRLPVGHPKLEGMK